MSQFDKRNLSMMIDTRFSEFYKNQKSVTAADNIDIF